VEISVNDGDWIVVTGIDSWNYEWNSKSVDNGEYEIRVRAFDGEDYSNVVIWKVTVNNNEDNGGGGFLPGFEITGLLFILTCCVYVLKKKN